jgi:hypothetical protein
MTGFSDLYGFRQPELESARSLVELALGVKLSPHDSLYRGGNYYLLKEVGAELILQRNYDLLDKDLAEPEYPDTRVLLYVDGRGRAEEIAGLLSACAPDVTLLRRVRYEV